MRILGDKMKVFLMKILILNTLFAALLIGCSKKPSEPEVKLADALFNGDVNGIEQHIKAGTDLNQLDPNGSSPLLIAATFGHADVCRVLTKAGVKLDVRNKDGSTALMTGAFLCYPEVVKVLLSAGADKEIKNNAGATALDSVAGPWAEVKPIYDLLDAAVFKPSGKPLDYDRIQKTRPTIVEILKGN